VGTLLLAWDLSSEHAVDDRALNEAILKLSAPLQMEQVTVRMEPGEVEVRGEAGGTVPFGCPKCEFSSPIHDHFERWWRHLDNRQFRTLLCAYVPRVRCTTHGVRSPRVPWAERGSRFSPLFERRKSPGSAWLPQRPWRNGWGSP
jgi:transposase